jgi:hypothetical protein
MLHRHRPLRRRVQFAAFVVSVLLPAVASAQKVMVDGDLSDLGAFAPVVALDPASDVSTIMASGFDFTRVLVHYYPKRDTLYLGLDLMDSFEGPGVAGDADGDKNPSARTHPEVPEDQTGVGPKEYYIFEIDTDQDGNFAGYQDLRVKFKNNAISLERGDGSAPAPGLRGRVAIGTRGASHDPRLPNQNRQTDDVEMSIFGYANQDNTPRSFAVRVRAGSLVDGLPDDTSDDPIEFGFPEILRFRTRFADPDQRTLGDCAVAFPGDIVTVEATVTNLGAFPLRPAWMVLHFPTGLEYVAGSVGNATEGRDIPSSDGQVVRFVWLGGDAELSPGETATVTFAIRVVSFPTCHMTIRGYAEGVIRDGSNDCEFSCLETICLVE